MNSLEVLPITPSQTYRMLCASKRTRYLPVSGADAPSSSRPSHCTPTLPRDRKRPLHKVRIRRSSESYIPALVVAPSGSIMSAVPESAMGSDPTNNSAATASTDQRTRSSFARAPRTPLPFDRLMLQRPYWRAVHTGKRTLRSSVRAHSVAHLPVPAA